MARSIIVAFAATYGLAVVQATLGARLTIAGVSPDLLFVWSVCLGLLCGPRAGAAAGFGSGLFEGALQQAHIGALAVSKGLSGYVAGLLAARLFRENWLVPALCAAGLTVANELILLALAGESATWTLAARRLGVRVIYHAALAPPTFAAIVRVRRALLGRQAQVG